MKSCGSAPGKLASTCHPVSPGSMSEGNLTGNDPIARTGTHRSSPTSWLYAQRNTSVFAALTKGSCEYQPSLTTGLVHVERSCGSTPISFHKMDLTCSASA